MKPRAHKVAVVNTNGRILKTIKRTPVSFGGFDSYRYQGSICAGYWNGAICSGDIDAYIKVYNQ